MRNTDVSSANADKKLSGMGMTSENGQKKRESVVAT